MQDTRDGKMDRAAAQEPTSWTPPYISWRLLLRLVERLESNRPPRIDRTVLTGSNQSKSQTILALKSLELIDQEGALTASFTQLIEAGDRRPAVVHALLERFYEGPVELGRVNGTQQQLEEEFRRYGVSGSTVRKAISFFLKAAEYAELQTSPHFRVPPAPRRPKKPQPPSPPPPPKSESGTEVPAKLVGASPGHERPETGGTLESIESLRVGYIKMLVESVRPDAESPGNFDSDVLDRIERLLGFGPEREPEGPP